MEVKKLGRIVDSIWENIISVFNIGVNIVSAGMTIFMVFGACASMMLLYKMYPDMYLLLSGPMTAVFSLVFILLKIVGIVLIVLACFYIIFAVMYIFKDQSITIKKKREMNRKKFMNEVVARLKKEVKK